VSRTIATSARLQHLRQRIAAAAPRDQERSAQARAWLCTARTPVLEAGGNLVRPCRHPSTKWRRSLGARGGVSIAGCPAGQFVGVHHVASDSWGHRHTEPRIETFIDGAIRKLIARHCANAPAGNTHVRVFLARRWPLLLGYVSRIHESNDQFVTDGTRPRSHKIALR
jgi:hypothetical protein